LENFGRKWQVWQPFYGYCDDIKPERKPRANPTRRKETEMRNIRVVSLVLVAVLIVAFIAFAQVFVLSPNSVTSAGTNPGMGDLRVAEAQQGFIPVTGGHASSQSYSGMGDLRLLDASRDTPFSGLNNIYTGMGDLRLFESQP
jgi:hypothetical protein